ncbi:MAG: hypothetical protein ACRCS3_05675 [Paracoccaceae bacterium]
MNWAYAKANKIAGQNLIVAMLAQTSRDIRRAMRGLSACVSSFAPTHCIPHPGTDPASVSANPAINAANAWSFNEKPASVARGGKKSLQNAKVVWSAALLGRRKTTVYGEPV